MVIKLVELLSDDTKKTELPGNLNWAGETGMPGMSRNAKLAVGQGASPGKQGGQKPWEIDLIGVVMDHNPKNQRKRIRKSSITLGDFIINDATIKKAQNISRDMGKKSEMAISSKNVNNKVKLGDTLKMKYPILKCFNEFSILEIDDFDDIDANEVIYGKTKVINKCKKYENKRKNKKKLKKKTANSDTVQQTQQHAGTMDGKCFTDNCTRRNIHRRKS